MTDDGLPAIGWIGEKTYLLATHSGVTLAPALSNIAAEEIMTGSENSALAPFRPQRLLNPMSKKEDHDRGLSSLQ